LTVLSTKEVVAMLDEVSTDPLPDLGVKKEEVEVEGLEGAGGSKAVLVTGKMHP
jgi:hypothetical protein